MKALGTFFLALFLVSSVASAQFSQQLVDAQQGLQSMPAPATLETKDGTLKLKDWVGPCKYQSLPYVGLDSLGDSFWGGTFDLPHDRNAGTGSCLDDQNNRYVDVWRIPVHPGDVVNVAFAGAYNTRLTVGDYSPEYNPVRDMLATYPGSGSLAGSYIAGWLDFTIPATWTQGYMEVRVIGLSSNATQTYFMAVTNETWSCGDATTLCLNGFTVSVDWRTADGRSGRGQAISMTSDTGSFWFFNSANVELVIKVLDGRTVNGHYWVFYGALSNVGYTISVTDTQTGARKIYSNPQGSMASVGDTMAFQK